jgi:hypothetical protein
MKNGVAFSEYPSNALDLPPTPPEDNLLKRNAGKTPLRKFA